MLRLESRSFSGHLSARDVADLTLGRLYAEGRQLALVQAVDRDDEGGHESDTSARSVEFGTSGDKCEGERQRQPRRRKKTIDAPVLPRVFRVRKRRVEPVEREITDLNVHDLASEGLDASESLSASTTALTGEQKRELQRAMNPLSLPDPCLDGDATDASL